MCKDVLSAVVCFLLGLVAVVYSQEAVPYGVEFQVNTYTKLDQRDHGVAGLPDGGFVVCWISHGQDDSSFGVFGQVLEADGSKRGAEFLVNRYTSGRRDNHRIATLPDGGFVVCWESYPVGGSEWDVFGQIFEADGRKRGAEFQVNTYTEDHQLEPTLASLPDGGFVVCWESPGQDGSGNGIFGQVFEADGRKRGAELQVNTYTQHDQRASTPLPLPDGGFVVCWESGGQDGSGNGIFGQVFEADGGKRGAEFQVNTYTTCEQWNHRVARLPDGGFVVCWQSYGQDGSRWGVFGQVFEADGRKRGAEFQVNTYTKVDQLDHGVAGLPDGGFVVCWESYRVHGSEWDVFGQIFEADGRKRGAEFQVNTYTEDHQWEPTLAPLPDGGFVVCWESHGQDGDGGGIFAKRFPNQALGHTLRTFSLIGPQNDATLNTTEPTLSWHYPSDQPKAYPWEITYDVWLDTVPDFASPQVYRGGLDTTTTVNSLPPGTTYFWKVLARNVAGDSLWSSQTWAFFVKHGASGVEGVPDNLPTRFQLLQNYPNPFNAATRISYGLPAEAGPQVTKIVIYDFLGRIVRVLVDSEQHPGDHSVVWNGKNMLGRPVASGVYVYSLQAGHLRASRKLLLMR